MDKKFSLGRAATNVRDKECLGEVRILPETTLQQQKTLWTTLGEGVPCTGRIGQKGALCPQRPGASPTVSCGLWKDGTLSPPSPTHLRTHHATGGLGTGIQAGGGAHGTSPCSSGPRCSPSRYPPCAGRFGAGSTWLLGRSPRRAPARPYLRQPRAPYPAGAARDCGARALSAPSGPGPSGAPNRSPASPRPAPAPWLPAPVPRPAPAAAARTTQRCSGCCCRGGRVSSYLLSAAGGSEAGPGGAGLRCSHSPSHAPVSRFPSAPS